MFSSLVLYLFSFYFSLLSPFFNHSSVYSFSHNVYSPYIEVCQCLTFLFISLQFSSLPPLQFIVHYKLTHLSVSLSALWLTLLFLNLVLSSYSSPPTSSSSFYLLLLPSTDVLSLLPLHSLPTSLPTIPKFVIPFLFSSLLSSPSTALSSSSSSLSLAAPPIAHISSSLTTSNLFIKQLLFLSTFFLYLLEYSYLPPSSSLLD